MAGTMKIVLKSLYIVFSFLLLCSIAFGRVEFVSSGFSTTNFHNTEKLNEICNGPAASSFWCHNLDANLKVITTKGKDIFFNEAGEVVALYSKGQRGQDFRGRYPIDSGQNLIPIDATIPGGALLIDGEYFTPEVNSSSWDKTTEDEIVGEISYQVGNYQVKKTLVINNIDNTIKVALTVSAPTVATSSNSTVTNSNNSTVNVSSSENEDKANSLVENSDASVAEIVDESARISYAFPGIARNRNPIIKIGQTNNLASTNPLLNIEVPDPSYVSFQSNPTRGVALIMHPDAKEDLQELVAVSLPNNNIAFTKGFTNSNAELKLNVYGGPNELVRLYQEGLYQFPNLFNPNIIGRLSLGVLVSLEALHNYIGNWGLSIIALTLIFRILIWPLMSTQTRSMVGMQKLQPKLKALQKKYKDNREKLGQETMKLYKQAGVNPAMGCLPILIQMPIFIILWRVFMNYEFNESFLWVPDLGLSDPTYLLPIIYVGIMVVQSILMAKGNPQQLQQTLIFNVVFAFIMVGFPAGVLLYWVASMLVQVGQHYLIQRSMKT